MLFGDLKEAQYKNWKQTKQKQRSWKNRDGPKIEFHRGRAKLLKIGMEFHKVRFDQLSIHRLLSSQGV